MLSKQWLIGLHQIIFRDLAARNVLVHEDDTAKVCLNIDKTALQCCIQAIEQTRWHNC